MNLILYAVLALAIMSGIGYGYKVVKDSGREEVRLEWAQENEKAKAKADADRARQDALRQAQDKQATERLANEKKRTAGLMVSLEAHIRASGAAAQCVVPSVLLDDWNSANAGPKGVGPGTVPTVSPKPAPPS